jgi:hypothetical protein
MEIIHRIVVNSKQTKAVDILNELGLHYNILDLPGRSSKLVSFDISEENSNWPIISMMKNEFSLSDMFQTIFTETEIANSKWVRLIPIYQQGYPYPRKTWSKSPANYDNFCSECGTFTQKANFTIESEPKLRNHSFMSLIGTNALFGDFNTLGKLTQSDLKGYEQLPVLTEDSDMTSQTIWQLYFSCTTVAGGYISTESDYRTCLRCSEKKFLPHKRGPMQFDRSTIPIALDFVRTREWFGAAHFAYQELLVSSRVVDLVRNNNWQGIRFEPIELV